MRAAFFLSMVAVLAACSKNPENPAQDIVSRGSSEAPAAAATASKACDVLTPADASKALGRPVENLQNPGGAAGQDICQYGYQGERIADMGNVSVTVHPVDLASVIEGARAQGFALEPVEGLGDAAWYSPEVGLYVGKGQRTAHYLLAANGMGDPKGKVIALARDTVGRL